MPEIDQFRRALDTVLVSEGGYVNHPKDPGGPTNRGVTQAVYDDYRRSIGKPPVDVRQISMGEVATIYRRRYWDLIKGDALPPGLSYVVFDGAVNSGVARSIKWMQRALGCRSIDGIIGMETMSRLEAWADHDKLIAAIIEIREEFLRHLKNWKVFGDGWSNRIKQVLTIGQAWAAGSVGPAITYVAGGAHKAVIENAVPAPTLAVADASTGGGVGTIMAAGTIQQLQEQLTPFTGGSTFVQHIVVGLAIASAGLTIGGLAYRWWSKRKAARREAALA